MITLLGTAEKLYVLIDLLCAGILAGLEIGTLGRGVSKKDNRIMYWLLLSQSALFVLDAIWTLIDSNTNLPLLINYAINGCYFGTSGICAYVWLIFVDYHIDGKFLKTNTRRLILVWPIAIVAFLGFSAYFNGWLFTIDPTTYHYTRGPLFIIQPLIVYAYLIFGILDVVLSSSSFKLKTARTVERSILLLSIIPLVGGVAQIYMGGLPVANACMTMCLVYIYIIIQNERANYQSALIEGLSDEYKLVGLINVSNEYISIYRGRKYFQYMTQGARTTEIPVTKLVYSCAENFVYEDDKEEFLSDLSVAKIEYELSRRDEYSVDFRALYKGEYAYFQIKFAKSNSSAISSDMILFGIKNTDMLVKKELIAKEEIDRARLIAEYANKSKSTFLFNMSHDIRTPMNAILGFTEMAEKHIDDKERVADSLSKVKTSGQHLLNLINDILDMARIENGKVDIVTTPVDINDSIERLKFIVGDMAKDKDIKLKIKLNDIEHPYLYSDELHTNQILLNIISNSVKYTNNGGLITFTINEKPSIDNKKVRIEYIVSDTGIGMTPQFLEHVFDSFERDNTTAIEGIQGTGLGMSITKKLVDMMGGTIEVESILGQGSTFTVVLDYDIYEGDFEAERKEKEEKKAEQKEITLTGKRILLVDDNELNREIAVDILESAEAIVETAEDGVIAVEMVKSSDPGYYDLVLMDVQMPRLNGYDATRQIRKLEDETLKNIPIIAMTGNAFEEDKKNALEAGMNAHLAKPVDIAKLLETLSNFIY